MMSCSEIAKIIELNFKNQYSHFHAHKRGRKRALKGCKRAQRGVRSAQTHASGSWWTPPSDLYRHMR